jgi:uncharacterized membrane protein (UPF0127 family)
MLSLSTAEGVPVAPNVSVASSMWGRFRGLMGRSSLDQGEGLFMPGTNSIHMLFMRFPIDCVFMGAPRPDGSRKVVGVRENLAPWRGVVWWVRGARGGVVEMPAGTLATVGVKPGDYVRLEPAS